MPAADRESLFAPLPQARMPSNQPSSSTLGECTIGKQGDGTEISQELIGRLQPSNRDLSANTGAVGCSSVRQTSGTALPWAT